MSRPRIRLALLSGAGVAVLIAISVAAAWAAGQAGARPRPDAGPHAVGLAAFALVNDRAAHAVRLATVARVAPAAPARTQAGTGTETCTFDAGDSRYYRGLAASTAHLLGTGPIHFSWSRPDGAVRAKGGFWREYLARERVWVTYGNVVTAGSVDASGAVLLRFMGTPLTAGARPYAFTLRGRLSVLSGASRLTGRADGPNLFRASGRVTCGSRPAPPKAVRHPKRTPATARRVTIARTTRAPTIATCRTDDEFEGDDDDQGSAACHGRDDEGDDDQGDDDQGGD